MPDWHTWKWGMNPSSLGEFNPSCGYHDVPRYHNSPMWSLHLSPKIGVLVVKQLQTLQKHQLLRLHLEFLRKKVPVSMPVGGFNLVVTPQGISELGPLLETTCLSYGCLNSWTIPQKSYRLLGIVMANRAWKWKTVIYGWPKLAKSPKRGLGIFHLDLIRKSETCIDIWIIEQLSWCLPFCTWELATNGWRHFAFTNHPKKSVYSPSICSSTMLVGETLTFEVYPWNLNGFFR